MSSSLRPLCDFCGLDAGIIRNRSGGILRRTELPGCRLHRELHFVHHGATENGSERRVRSVSTVPDAYEARLWSKASRIEQDPASPKKSFDIGMKIRWIQAIGIGTDEPSRNP